jgi:release factor glutamine methyltransferase
MAPFDSAARAIVRDLLDDAVATLTLAGVEDAALDAELMLASVAGVSRVHVVMGAIALDEVLRRNYAAFVDRRAAREPLAYILGRKEFFGLDLEVTPNVLVPRPETETLVAAALEELTQRPAPLLDLGTGSGAIALAIAANAPDTMVVASDISDAALTVARRNAARLGLADQVVFRCADWFDERDGRGPLGRFDLIVSNPPYVADAEIAKLQPEITQWEPRLALAGGHDGLDFYRRIACDMPEYLGPGGQLMVEIGRGQADAVAHLLHDAGLGAINRLRDPSGIVRVLAARR